MERDKHVDESWKDSVAKEKDVDLSQPAGQDENEGMEVNFLNYVTSLAFQSLIFMGEIPNPITQKVDENIPQSKFLIDTLIMLRDKTKGNLSPEENDLLNASIYELQMKFIEKNQKGINP